MATIAIFKVTNVKTKENKKLKNIKNNESLKDSTSSSSNDSNNTKPHFKIINTTSLNEYHRTEESKKLLLKNDSQIIKNNFLIDFSFPKNFINKHSFHHKNRIKMIDYMIEIFSLYKSEPKTFFLAVNVMDLYFLRTKRKIENCDIHIIGLCSIFIASKMEDLIPLRLEQVIKILCKNKYNEENIKYVEKEILYTIQFDLINISIFDFVNYYLFDFEIKKKKELFYINDLYFTYKNICFFISKLCYYEEELCYYKNQFKVIAVFLIALDILKGITQINNEIETFFKNWIFFIMHNTKSNQKKIEKIYKIIVNLYQNMTTGKLEFNNLLKRHKLIVF